MSTFRAGAEHALRRCVTVLNAAGSGDDAMVDAVRASGEEILGLPDDEVSRLRVSTDTLRTIATATTLQEVCERLNVVLAGCRPPRLTAHGGTPWHLHIDHDDADWAEWFLASSAMSLAITTTETQQRPLGICAAPDCDNVFAADSPGRPRRFCSPACSSRVRVATHRAARP